MTLVPDLNSHHLSGEVRKLPDDLVIFEGYEIFQYIVDIEKEKFVTDIESLHIGDHIYVLWYDDTPIECIVNYKCKNQATATSRRYHDLSCKLEFGTDSRQCWINTEWQQTSIDLNVELTIIP